MADDTTPDEAPVSPSAKEPTDEADAYFAAREEKLAKVKERPVNDN
ncbi:MAG: hypothetical protein H3C27_14835 [Opitutaceae bacterium]|nr:hypothetical protein [Opitutaceae bacterium]